LSARLNRYYGRLRLPARPPPTSRRAPVIGRQASGDIRHTQATGPDRVSPVPAVTIRTFRAPYAGESFGACSSRSSAPSMAFALRIRARHSLFPSRDGTFTTRQASLHATDRPVAPPQGLSTLGFDASGYPRRRQPATGPPGRYPDRTHTGKQRRARPVINRSRDQPPTNQDTHPTMSNLASTSGRMKVLAVAAKRVPEPAGPPGLTNSVPILCAWSLALTRSTAILVFGPFGSS